MAYRKLIEGVSQYDVDFVIPRHGPDLNLCVDPFLLFKSRDPDVVQLHNALVSEFNLAIKHIRDEEYSTAERILTVHEAVEIGFGYSVKGRRGTGVGEFIARCVVDAVANSPKLRDRGVRHVEELGLYSVGIGPDRLSDMVGGYLKEHLIKYTERQCEAWKIPIVKGAPVQNIFSFDTHDWYDDFADLPVSPIDGRPILLVPRRWVRQLPFISYDDFRRSDLTAIMRARLRSAQNKARIVIPSKEVVVSDNRRLVERVDKYVDRKERQAIAANPTLGYLKDDDVVREALRLKEELAKIEPGAPQAGLYQDHVLAMLNFLFNPGLSNGEKEVRTVEGTERRDVIFTNESDETFWSYVRLNHLCIILMIECKNKNEIDNSDVNQAAEYLGDRLGFFGIIACRNQPTEERQRKLYTVWNNVSPRKLVITLSDADFGALLDTKARGGNPTDFIQAKYRRFRTSVQ
ncbi:MAG: hypothetical protein ACYC96_15540 [Fimbriimonadaceae bacterium]